MNLNKKEKGGIIAFIIVIIAILFGKDPKGN